MCDNLKPDRVRCDACRTINLANRVKYAKPNMEIYDKCTPAQKIECTNIPELGVNPTCIKVCTKEEFKLSKIGKKPMPPKMPPIAPHGKLMYLIKACVLGGTVYFTYHQGVWGAQEEATECWARWQQYMKSINSRQRPTFDKCGNVIRKDIGGSLVAPIYDLYKEFVTAGFSGIVKMPLIIKCAYIDYLKALERRREELAKEKKIKK